MDRLLRGWQFVLGEVDAHAFDRSESNLGRGDPEASGKGEDDFALDGHHRIAESRDVGFR